MGLVKVHAATALLLVRKVIGTGYLKAASEPCGAEKGRYKTASGGYKALPFQ